MKISACWIAKDEAGNIRRSIESVKNITDELIVVDTGSADNTAEIAESLGARVARFEWINDFSAARNYAIEQASGDVIIFLDADEWFVPRLGPSDRERIEGIFSRNPKVDMLSINIDNLDSDGALIGSSMVCRIYRNKSALRYQGSIHEYIPSKPDVNLIVHDGLGIKHTGYGRDIAGVKMKRNAALLENALDSAAEGSDDRYRFLLYLVRESFQTEKYDKASEYLVELLKHPDALERICRSLSEEILSAVYAAILTAHSRRRAVSRRDVRLKLFDLFKKFYPDYPGTAEIGIMYQAFFDLKEDRFLRELEPAIKAAGAKHSQVSHYKDQEHFLYTRAAFAARRRGLREKAAEYAAAALKGGGDIGGWDSEMVHVLLNTLHGRPPEDVILALNDIFNISNPSDLEYLVRETRADGFLIVHCYYLKKLINSGNAYIRHQLRFLLANQKYEALVPAAAEAHSVGDVDAALYVFLAAVCGAPAALVEPHSDMLEEYARVLDAYRKRERLEEVTEQDLRLLEETYSTVALAVGVDAADRYLDVFRANPGACFTVKAAYCETSGLTEKLLAEKAEDMSVIDRLDFPCRQYIIQAMIATGRHGEALDGIEAFLEAEYTEPALLHMLLVIAEQASGDIKAKARRMYERYSEMYDAVIDLDDVVSTDIVFDEGGKKQAQFFKSMTRDRFDKYLSEEAARPAFRHLLRLYRQASDVYRQKGLPAESARCLWRVIAHGGAEPEIYEKLAEAFEELKNTALAGYIRTLAAA